MSEDWPAWAIEEVAVVESDPSWLPLAQKLGRDVEQRLGEILCGAVEHVGSTAVPGLAAKPVVDLMAPVDSQAAARSADEPLAAGGWWLVPPEFDGRPWRRFFVLAEGSHRRAHLHLVERDHQRWQDTLTFRDALREQPETATAYAALKRELASRYPDDRETYSAAKTAFVEQVLAAARWAPGQLRTWL